MEPLMAPQAMVTNSSGTRLGVPAGTLSLKAGATMFGAPISTATYSSPRPRNSCRPLM